MERTGAGNFINPQEEIEYLRAQLAKEGINNLKTPEGAQAARSVVGHYVSQKPEAVLAPEHRATEEEIGGVVLQLSPEEHDTQIAELLGILQTRGLRNAFSVAERLEPHLLDDFYRVLIEYLAEGYTAPQVPKRGPVWKALHLVLLEISIPSSEVGDKEKQLKVLISAMEQLFAGMLGSTKSTKVGEDYFSLELGVAHTHEDVVFYVAVPREKKELFEKQLLSVFSRARIIVKNDDYNVFRSGGAVAASIATLGEREVYPLKTYEQFDQDPLNIILSSFSKLEKVGEGAALQILVSSVGDKYNRKYRKAVAEIQKGIPVGRATQINKSLFYKFMIGVEKFSGERKHDPTKPIDQIAVEQITEKIKTPVVATNIRLIASAATSDRAESVLSMLESSFNQFESGVGNRLEFKRMSGSRKKKLLKDYSLRLFSLDTIVPLNLKELTSLYHLTAAGVSSSRELKQTKAKVSPAPLNIPTTGTLLGVNRVGNSETKVYMSEHDRLRHFYVIGQTGTGKSWLLKNMIIQDIHAGHGVAMIDPHGADILDVLANIPEERFKDVIYVDPGYTERPFGLNMLEFDPRFPEQKTFVVDELLAIFNKLFDMKIAGGPAFEQYFRNSALLVMEHPESGNTLFEIGRVLADKDFRDFKLSHCKNPVITQFWENAERTSGEQSLANYVPYVTNKFDVFTTNEIMRPIIGQERSSFNMRDIMDGQKILLINLSKGRMGELNSALLGLIIVGKILIAALSRGDVLHLNPPPFYFYIDEFQNVTTDSIATIFSEARKYKLSLNVAHQFISQLDEKIKNSVFGNVGSMTVFRVGPDDAEFLKTQFEPTFTAGDLLQLDNFNAYAKLLVDGKPATPFNLATLPTPKGNPEQIEVVKQLSYNSYGRPREEVEKEIQSKYHQSTSS